MRYHKAGNTLAMLMDGAVPRRPDGALDICADCQRRMWCAGGYIQWLADRLLSLVSIRERLDRIPAFVAQMKVGERRAWRDRNPHKREHLRLKIAALSDEFSRTYRVRTWTCGKVEVWRLA